MMMGTLEDHQNGRGFSPKRKRSLFYNAFLSSYPRSTRHAALRIRISLAMWFILCASLSALLFTWTVITTVDQNRMLEPGIPISIGLQSPYHRMTTSRDMLHQAEHHQKYELRKQPPLPLDDVVPRDSTSNEETIIMSPKEEAAGNLRVPPSVVGTTVTPLMDAVPAYLRIPEDEKVVQVINTRFMQHQPHLLELGLARLELMKTLCLPTLVGQTSQNFLWVIRADPELHDTVKRSLLEVIQNATEVSNLHVVVLGSNDNPNGFRRDLTDHPDDVWSQNYALLDHFHQAAQSRIVLETRLDADDGLHIYFVETMQEDAVRYLGTAKPNWLVWCAGTHVEWQYGTPWTDMPYQENNTTKNNTTKPAQNSSSIQVGDSSFGSLLPGLTRGCITPGLTKGYGKDVAFEEVPEAQHHKLHWQMTQCKKEKPAWEHCLVVWKRLVPTAVRGRTPTSAGMQFVLGKHVSYLSPEAKDALGLQEDNMLDKQGIMWDSVIQRFNITKESVKDMRQYLTGHMHGIALDNLEGQCTQGHSCKNSSQEILQHLAEETAQDGNSTTSSAQ